MENPHQRLKAILERKLPSFEYIFKDESSLSYALREFDVILVHLAAAGHDISDLSTAISAMEEANRKLIELLKANLRLARLQSYGSSNNPIEII